MEPWRGPADGQGHADPAGGLDAGALGRARTRLECPRSGVRRRTVGSAPLHDPAPAALAAVPRAVLVPPASPRRALARAGAGGRRGGLSHLHAHATERAARRDAGASPRTAAGRRRHARASGRDAEPARPGARHPIGAPLSRRRDAADGRRDRSSRRCHCVRSGLRRAVARGPDGCRRGHGSPGAAAHRGRPVGRRRAVRARAAARSSPSWTSVARVGCRPAPRAGAG